MILPRLSLVARTSRCHHRFLVKKNGKAIELTAPVAESLDFPAVPDMPGVNPIKVEGYNTLKVPWTFPKYLGRPYSKATWNFTTQPCGKMEQNSSLKKSERQEPIVNALYASAVQHPWRANESHL